MIMKKLMASAAALLSVSLMLTGCGSSASSSASAVSQSGAGTQESSGSAASGKDLEEFDLVLDWYPNAVHTFLYDALEKGYFADEGLNVKIMFPANDNDALSLAAAGKVDAGLYYMDDAIMTNANENVPVKVFGTVVNQSLDIITSLADKHISRPKDLEGKTLGYCDSLFGEAVIKCMMENDGSSVDKVNLVNVGFDLMSAMTTGNADATYGCYINHEVPQLEKEGFKVNTFKLTDYGVPDFYALVFVAGADKIDKNTEKYAKFLRGCQKGFEDMKNDPENSLQILLDNQDSANFALDPDVESKSIKILLPMMEGKDKPFLYQDPAVYQKNIDWLKKNGLIKKTISTDDIIVNPLEESK